MMKGQKAIGGGTKVSRYEDDEPTQEAEAGADAAIMARMKLILCFYL